LSVGGVCDGKTADPQRPKLPLRCIRRNVTGAGNSMTNAQPRRPCHPAFSNIHRAHWILVGALSALLPVVLALCFAIADAPYSKMEIVRHSDSAHSTQPVREFTGWGKTLVAPRMSTLDVGGSIVESAIPTWAVWSSTWKTFGIAQPVVEEGFGWPCRVLCYQYEIVPAATPSGWDNVLTNGVDIGHGTKAIKLGNATHSYPSPAAVIPYGFIALGYALNALFFFLFFSILLMSNSAAQFRRRLQNGLCTQCGYNLVANKGAICPECGQPMGL